MTNNTRTRSWLLLTIAAFGLCPASRVMAETAQVVSIERLANIFVSSKESGVGRVSSATDTRSHAGFRYVVQVVKRQAGSHGEVEICSYEKLYVGQLTVFSVNAESYGKRACTAGYSLIGNDLSTGFLLGILAPPAATDELVRLPSRVNVTAQCGKERVVTVRSTLISKRSNESEEERIFLNDSGTYIPLASFLSCAQSKPRTPTN